MAYKEVFTCDMCGTSKGKNNHWFLGRIPIKNTNSCNNIYVKPFDEDTAKLDTVATLCGEACVHRFISQHLAEL
jgi:hypothetical protein